MEKPEKLESIYDDPAWKEAQRELVFGKLEKRLWRVGTGMFITVCLISAGIVSALTGTAGLFSGMIGAVIGIVVVYIISGVLAIILAFIPYKGTDYSMRVLFWVPTNIILLMLLVIAYLIVMFFGLKPGFNPQF
jgi:amino acid transporter